MNYRSSFNMPGAATVVFLAMLILFVPWLGETLFYSKGEPREAIVGMSILQSGEWILPLNYGTDIPYKPPFLGWLIAALAWLLNGGVVNEFIARLPSALAAIAMIMGGYAWARRERGVRFAMIFSFVTACSFEVFRAALACRLDMVLTACMVGAIYLMYHIREHAPRHKVWLYVLVWLMLTCATLTKGPVGALLPCFVMGVYRLLRRDRFFPTLALMLGLSLLALVLPAWWFYEAWQRGGDHFYDLMMEENIGRLLGRMSYESHVQPVWYNFVTLIAGLLPWTLLLLASLLTARRARLAPLKPAGLLCLTAAVLIVGFYCIPDSKRSVYLLPAYPFICYAITCVIDSKTALRPLRVFTWIMAVLGVLAPIAIVVMQFVTVGGLTLAPLPWWGWPLLAVPAAAGVAWMANRHSPAAHVCAIVWTLYLAYVAVGMPAVLNPRSDARVLPRLTTGATVISAPANHRFYSLNFYLDNKLRAVDLSEAAKYPSGTLVLIPMAADTTGLSRDFNLEPLMERGADFRNRVGLAIKK